MISAGKPCTFAEAEQEEAWRAAMRNEVDSIEQNQTWELIDLPQGHRPITLKWVFKLKKGETGEVVKHKARLVARGFIQQAGVDFDEVLAPIARMESVRLLLALAAKASWNVHSMDVKSAFLNGDRKRKSMSASHPGSLFSAKNTRCCGCARHSMGCGKHLGHGTRSWTRP
jgi:hypothetical protein